MPSHLPATEGRTPPCHPRAAQDVEALVNGLLAVVRTTMKKDLQSSTASSVLLLKQVSLARTRRTQRACRSR